MVDDRRQVVNVRMNAMSTRAVICRDDIARVGILPSLVTSREEAWTDAESVISVLNALSSD